MLNFMRKFHLVINLVYTHRKKHENNIMIRIYNCHNNQNDLKQQLACLDLITILVRLYIIKNVHIMIPIYYIFISFVRNNIPFDHIIM